MGGLGSGGVLFLYTRSGQDLKRGVDGVWGVGGGLKWVFLIKVCSIKRSGCQNI